MKNNQVIMLNKDIPKIAQRIISDALVRNNPRYLFVLIHRQYGKTHLIYKLSESYLLNHKHPKISIFASSLKQCTRLYKERFENNLQQFKTSYDKSLSRLTFNKIINNNKLKEKCAIDFYGSNFNPDSDRGGTYSFQACDEYGSMEANYASRVVAPMGDVHKAPLFITGTPIAPNHFMKEFEYAEKKMKSGDKDFFTIKWTILDSLKHNEISEKEYNTIKKRYEINSESWNGYLAEYMLNWFAYRSNIIYAYELQSAKTNGNIGYYPYIPELPVDTSWDIGVNGTAVWLKQEFKGQHRYFAYYDSLQNVHLQSFIQEKIRPLSQKMTFRYHIFPHDIKFKELLSKESRLEIVRKLLPGTVIPFPPNPNPMELIDRCRRNFSRCVFDQYGASKGISALQNYMMKGNKPLKDQNSHGADAFTLSENFDILQSNTIFNDSIPQYLTDKELKIMNRNVRKNNKWWLS